MGKEVKRRILSLFLIVALFCSGLPSSLAVKASTAESDNSELSIAVNYGSILVENGKVTDEVFPEGVTYDQDTAMLTLHDAQLEELYIDGGTVTVQLEGENSIIAAKGHNENPFCLQSKANAVITGSGSLELYTEETDAFFSGGGFENYWWL